MVESGEERTEQGYSQQSLTQPESTTSAPTTHVPRQVLIESKSHGTIEPEGPRTTVAGAAAVVAVEASLLDVDEEAMCTEELELEGGGWTLVALTPPKPESTPVKRFTIVPPPLMSEPTGVAERPGTMLPNN